MSSEDGEMVGRDGAEIFVQGWAGVRATMDSKDRSECGQLYCPVCGSYLVHFEACEQYPDWEQSGTAIEVWYFCEEQHRFVIKQWFSHGSIYVKLSTLPWEYEEWERPDELWRD